MLLNSGKFQYKMNDWNKRANATVSWIHLNTLMISILVSPCHINSLYCLVANSTCVNTPTLREGVRILDATCTYN